jgi:acyl carrier protein
MDKLEVTDKLTHIFRKVFNDESLILKDEMTASDVENWTSLTNMILITEIENAFTINFKLKDLNKMKKVGDMVDSICSKLSITI